MESLTFYEKQWADIAFETAEELRSRLKDAGLLADDEDMLRQCVGTSLLVSFAFMHIIRGVDGFNLTREMYGQEISRFAIICNEIVNNEVRHH